MLTCIVLCRIFNSRSLWALGQTHDQRTIISNVTSNNPHQDGPQLRLFLFNFSHPEPITKVSIDGLFLQFHWWVLPPILVAAFGRIAASKAHSLTQLHLREALERGELFLLMGSHFQKHEKLQRREWFFSASSMPVESATKQPLTFKDTLEKYNQTLQLQGGTFTYCPHRCPEAVAECHLKCHGSHR